MKKCILFTIVGFIITFVSQSKAEIGFKCFKDTALVPTSDQIRSGNVGGPIVTGSDIANDGKVVHIYLSDRDPKEPLVWEVKPGYRVKKIRNIQDARIVARRKLSPERLDLLDKCPLAVIVELISQDEYLANRK